MYPIYLNNVGLSDSLYWYLQTSTYLFSSFLDGLYQSQRNSITTPTKGYSYTFHHLNVTLKEHLYRLANVLHFHVDVDEPNDQIHISKFPEYVIH